MRTKGGGFPDRRRKFQGKLTLILQDLFFLPSRAARVFAVIVHQKSTKPAPELCLSIGNIGGEVPEWFNGSVSAAGSSS